MTLTALQLLIGGTGAQRFDYEELQGGVRFRCKVGTPWCISEQM